MTAAYEYNAVNWLTAETMVGNTQGGAGANQTSNATPGNDSDFSEEVAGIPVDLPNIGNVTQAWEYDLGGNRTSQSLTDLNTPARSGTTEYTFDTLDLHQLASEEFTHTVFVRPSTGC